MEKPLYQYFLDGFHLLNKNIYLFVISLGFSLATTLLNLPSASIWRLIAMIVGLIILLFLSGYTTSIPLFLTFWQENKKVDFQYIKSMTIQTTKRLIKPYIILLVLFSALVILGLLLLVIVSGGNKSAFTAFFQQFSNQSGLFYVYFSPIVLVLSFFAFFPIYFTLEKNGFIDSLKKSFNLSRKNVWFILLLAVLSIIINWTSTIIISMPALQNSTLTFNYRLLMFVRRALNIYGSLFLAASTLLFYQDRKKT